MPSMPSRPTLDEVAALAKVSRATASRAVNGDRWVSPESRAAVEVAVRQLGWSPNQAARSLALRRTDSIALVVPEPDLRVLTDTFLSRTVHAVNLTAAAADLQLQVLMLGDDADERRLIRFLSGGHCDGAIVVSHHGRGSLTTSLGKLGQPVVLLGRPFVGEPDLPYVDVDNVQGGRLAAELLLGLGRQRLATLSGPPDMVAGTDRLTGWRETLAAAGVSSPEAAGDFTRTGGRRAMSELLDACPYLDAVFVASDQMAEGALAALQLAGRRVPEDVAVVGFDDFAAAAELGLTTVVNPVQDMGAAAVDLLVRQIAGEAPRPVIFPTHLVRRTTA